MLEGQLFALNYAPIHRGSFSILAGLAKAFFYAGARALLVSHWPVFSKSTTDLTTSMFETIRNNPTIGRAEALRRSMMEMASHRRTAHPIFWAPFVVVGEGGVSRP